MKYWTEFNSHFADLVGKNKQVDNTIYTFDIETTSYLILNGKQILANHYLELSKDEQEKALFRSCMYIWQFSINKDVYFRENLGGI